MENRRIEYQYSTDERSLDLLNGVHSARKQVLRRDRPIRPLSSRITQLYVLGGCMVALFVALLFAEQFWKVPEGILHLRYGVLFAGILWLCQAFAAQSSFDRICRRDPDTAPKHGVFFLDAIGFCDTNCCGEMHKPLWRDFQACVVTPEIIVMLFDHSTLYCSYSVQIERELADALCERGLGSRIIHRRFT